MALVPVDHDPFAVPDGKSLVPVDHDPFAAPSSAPDKDDGLPWDVPLTGEQMRRGKEMTRKSDEALGEPSEPGLKHLLWSLVAEPMKIGQTALGQRPLPQGAEAFGMAASGAVPPPVARGVGAGVNATVGRLMPPGVAERPVPEGFMPFNEAQAIARQTGHDVRAADIIARRANQDAPTTAQGVIDTLTRAREAGKPMLLTDVLEGNVQSLAGRLFRKPGDSKEIVRRTLEERGSQSVGRLTGDLDKAFGSGSASQLFEDLVKTRSQAAKPLFEKAYEGGSMAPLETQFQNTFQEASAAEATAVRDLQAARQQLTAARGRQTQTGGNVYSTSGANQAERAAQEAVDHADRALTEAQTTKQQSLDFLRQAQEDGSIGKKGAVWNPRIQRFLDDADVQTGIRQGVWTEQKNAIAENRPFNLSEYAITGFDEAGGPIIGKVPTMRLLAAAKEGLDAMLQSEKYTNKLTGELTKPGVALQKFTREFVNELDKVNPDYKAARAQWAGASQSMQALKWGQEDALRDHPDTIARKLQDMSEGEREFAKLGLAQTLRDIANKRGPLAAEFDKIAGTRWGGQFTRDQIRPFFTDDTALNRFVDSVTAETKMARSGDRILKGAQTAERHAEDQSTISPADAAQFGISSALGHPISAMHAAGRMGRDWLATRGGPLNTNISRILMDPKTTLEIGADGKLVVVPSPRSSLNPTGVTPESPFATSPMSGPPGP